MVEIAVKAKWKKRFLAKVFLFREFHLLQCGNNIYSMDLKLLFIKLLFIILHQPLPISIASVLVSLLAVLFEREL